MFLVSVRSIKPHIFVVGDADKDAEYHCIFFLLKDGYLHPRLRSLALSNKADLFSPHLLIMHKLYLFTQDDKTPLSEMLCPYVHLEKF